MAPALSSMLASQPRLWQRRFWPVATAAVAAAIFVFDTVTPIELAAGEFYVAVVLMALRFLKPRNVLIVAAVCVALMLLSHYLSHLLFHEALWAWTAVTNRLLAIGTVAAATVLALMNQSAQMALRRAELERVTRLVTLGELTASIAHEVRQPIAGVVINGYACLRWLAREPPDLERARGAAENLIKDGHRASDVLQRIRAAIKGSPLQTRRLNINEIIADAIALTRAEVQRNDVSLKVELSPALPSVAGDCLQLQHVILNLLVNAIEAMTGADDRRELRVTSKSHETNSVLVAVCDSGPGLDSGSLERVFDALHTTKPGGMGMGLTICRSIITAHGGRMWAAHNTPKGAIFQFTLPASADLAPGQDVAEVG